MVSARSTPTGSAGKRPFVIVAAAGLILVVVGTFLPWLQSGSVSRSSYQAAGLLRSLVHPNGLPGTVLAGWPFVSAASALAIALLVMERIGLAAIVTILAAFAAGAVSVATLTATGQGLVQPVRTGPISTLCGCAVAVLATAITLILPVRRPERFDDHTSGADLA